MGKIHIFTLFGKKMWFGNSRQMSKFAEPSYINQIEFTNTHDLRVDVKIICFRKKTYGKQSSLKFYIYILSIYIFIFEIFEPKIWIIQKILEILRKIWKGLLKSQKAGKISSVYGQISELNGTVYRIFQILFLTVFFRKISQKVQHILKS